MDQIEETDMARKKKAGPTLGDRVKFKSGRGFGVGTVVGFHENTGSYQIKRDKTGTVMYRTAEKVSLAGE